MSRGVIGKFGVIVALLCVPATLLSAAIAGAKSNRVDLTGVVVKVRPPTLAGNGPRTISTLYQGTKKVGKLNLTADCAINECVEGGYAHIKILKLTGEKSGTLYPTLTDKFHGIPPKSAKSATGTFCVAKGERTGPGCVKATLTPADIATVGTHFKLVLG